MHEHVYLDASALMLWALAVGGSPNTRDIKGHDALCEIFESDAEVALSPVTLVEVSTNLNMRVRTDQDWFSGFDAAKAEQTIATVVGLIRTGGRVTPRGLGNRAFETAMMWVQDAITDRGKPFGAWDAVHLYEAVRWSRELGPSVAVTLATSDTGFTNFFEDRPELSDQVLLLDITA